MDRPPDLIAPAMIVALAMIAVGGIATMLHGTAEPGTTAVFGAASPDGVDADYTTIEFPPASSAWVASGTVPVPTATAVANATGAGGAANASDDGSP